jgi:hypothetical protein
MGNKTPGLEACDLLFDAQPVSPRHQLKRRNCAVSEPVRYSRRQNIDEKLHSVEKKSCFLPLFKLHAVEEKS